MAIGIGLFGVVHQTHLVDLMWPKDSLPVLDQRLTPATTVKAGPFVTNSDGFVAGIGGLRGFCARAVEFAARKCNCRARLRARAAGSSKAPPDAAVLRKENGLKRRYEFQR